MARLTVADIKPGELDETQAAIVCIYSMNEPLYAIYGTDTRVSVQFADDPATEQRQRWDFAALAPLQGEINGMIDGWHASEDARLKEKARIYDRRVADALVVALTRDVASAQAILQKIRDELLADRTSLQRLIYLVWALVSSLLVIGGASLGAYLSAPERSGFWGNTDLLWMGAGGGSVGAFFSITLAVHTRAFQPQPKYTDNAIAAVVRVIISAIAGAMLIAFLCTNMFSLTIGGLHLGGAPIGENSACAPAVLPLLILAFVAGFAERLVPDLLNSSSAAAEKALLPLVPPRPAGQQLTPPAAGRASSAAKPDAED